MCKASAVSYCTRKTLRKNLPESSGRLILAACPIVTASTRSSTPTSLQLLSNLSLTRARRTYRASLSCLLAFFKASLALQDAEGVARGSLSIIFNRSLALTLLVHFERFVLGQ